MLGGEAIEPRHEFVYARVVLHGAGAQRIHPQVDGVVPGGKPREVAEDFDLADFGESPATSSRAWSAPNTACGSAAGTSSGGSSMPRLPGADFSKISPSF